jgi:sugar phosphate isomerase/epimerase
MSYTVGVSSGMFMTASQEEKPQFLTIPRKIFRGGLEGVDFTQLDIESITEFKEPDLKKETEKIRNLGIRFGVHGESYAMGGGEKPMGLLDSAIETDYIHSHDRLMKHIEGCGMIGAEYVNVHPSETTPFLKLTMQLQPTKLVDPWGRSFKEFFEENPKLLDWVIEEDNDFLWEFLRTTAKSLINRNIQDRRDRYILREKKEPDMKKIEEEVKEEVKTFFVEQISTPELAYGAEKAAYYIIAKWMMNNNDPLWKNMVGKKISDKDLRDEHAKWVPAVSAKYIYGHFKPKDTKKFPDPLKVLEKNKLYFVFEAQMGTSGLEGLQRLVRPIDMIHLCEAIDSPWVVVCIDFEHILSQNLDPKKEVEEIPRGKGKFVKVLHLGFPTPHTPAHMPLDVGSREQLYLYEIIYELRQRGFKEGFLIFERGAAARGTSLLAIKKIKEFLEKETPPGELPIEFYGMSEEDFRVKKQQVAITDHALDPLKDVLTVPEEEFTFLSSEAVKKGKREEWLRRRYR